MPYKRQELLILLVHLHLSPVFGEVHVTYLFSFQCCVVLCLCFLFVCLFVFCCCCFCCCWVFFIRVFFGFFLFVFALFIFVLYIVCPMLSVVLDRDCPFLIPLSVFSNVYSRRKPSSCRKSPTNFPHKAVSRTPCLGQESNSEFQ